MKKWHEFGQTLDNVEETWLDILHQKEIICGDATYKGGEYFICEINTKICPFAADRTWEKCESYRRKA